MSDDTKPVKETDKVADKKTSAPAWREALFPERTSANWAAAFNEMPDAPRAKPRLEITLN